MHRDLPNLKCRTSAHSEIRQIGGVRGIEKISCALASATGREGRRSGLSVRSGTRPCSSHIRGNESYFVRRLRERLEVDDAGHSVGCAAGVTIRILRMKRLSGKRPMRERRGRPRARIEARIGNRCGGDSLGSGKYEPQQCERRCREPCGSDTVDVSAYRCSSKMPHVGSVCRFTAMGASLSNFKGAISRGGPRHKAVMTL